MALDLGSITRAVGGTYVAGAHTERTPIDGLSRVHEYVVVGNPAFATLVTGSIGELRTALNRADAVPAALKQAVFVSSANGTELRRLLAVHGMGAILGASLTGETLRLKLAAILADDQAADDRLVTAGTKVLAQVARRGGVPAVIAELSHRIDGWAVLLDPQGQLIASAGAGRLHVQDAAAVALGRPVRVRHQGLQTHQVGSDKELAGYLVIASRSRVTSRSRDLASQAAALFDLLLRKRDPSVTERLGRQALIDLLLVGGERASDLLLRWGVREDHLTAFELGIRGRAVDTADTLGRWLDDAGAERVFALDGSHALGFVPDEAVAALATQVQHFDAKGGGVMHLGIGLPAPVTDLQRSATQARQAVEAAIANGQRVLRFAELPTAGLVLGALDSERVRHVTAVLDPLREPGGGHGELTETLRVFLSENGRFRQSAARLGVHRQTLVARLRRAEELTGLSMDRADDRAAAWIALRSLGK